MGHIDLQTTRKSNFTVNSKFNPPCVIHNHPGRIHKMADSDGRVVQKGHQVLHRDVCSYHSMDRLTETVKNKQIVHY